MTSVAHKQLKLVKNDPYLAPFEDAIRGRYDYAKSKEFELTNGLG